MPKADGELPANLKKRAERKAAFANEWVNAYDPLPGNRCVTRLTCDDSCGPRLCLMVTFHKATRASKYALL